MAAGLEGYGGIVTDLYKNVTQVDDNAQADLARKASQADACVAPKFSAPSTCAPSRRPARRATDMLGPKQRLLAAYVASANDGSLDSAGQQWKTGESLLRRLATQLQTRSGQIGTDHRFSGESAKAASTAFSHSAKKMADRADEMRDGAAAFTDAAHAVRQAKKASDSFAKHAGTSPRSSRGPHRRQGAARLEDQEQPVLEQLRRPRDGRRTTRSRP